MNVGIGIASKHQNLITNRQPILIFKNHFTNLLNSILETKITWGPNSELKKYVKENGNGMRGLTSLFNNILDLDGVNARRIVKENPIFKDIPKKTILNNYNHLKNAGTSLSLIHENVLLLSQSSNELQNKIKLTKKFVNDINFGISLLYHEYESLNLFIKSVDKRISNKVIGGNQIIFFKLQLQANMTTIPDKLLCDIISKYLYYMVYHFEQSIQKIKLLLDYGIDVSSIIQNDWPLYCTYEHMKTRLQKCDKILHTRMIKPSIFLCSEDILNRKIQCHLNNNYKHNQRIMLISFLSKQLGYRNEFIKSKLRTVTVTNFEESKRIIDIILREGYDYHDIIQNVKVLSISEELLISRFLKLRTVNHKTPFLDVLLLNNEDFDKYVNSVG